MTRFLAPDDGIPSILQCRREPCPREIVLPRMPVVPPARNADSVPVVLSNTGCGLGGVL